MTNEEVNKQYQPIDQLIDSIPEESIAADDGVKYAKSGFALKVRLMLVVHHCKNMKLIDAEFPAPFTKVELSNLIKAPYTKDKLKQVKALQKKYAQLDEKSYRTKGEAA